MWKAVGVSREPMLGDAAMNDARLPIDIPRAQAKCPVEVRENDRQALFAELRMNPQATLVANTTGD